MRIFVSYRSTSREVVERLVAATEELGFASLEFDRHRDMRIPADEPWEAYLRNCIKNAKAVIFLMTSDWFESTICIQEFIWARQYGVGAIPTFIRQPNDDGDPVFPVVDAEAFNKAMPQNDFFKDLDSFRGFLVERQWRSIDSRALLETGSLSKKDEMILKYDLKHMGVDPKRFPFDVGKHDPYPGLAAMGQEHAGVFYGRNAQIGDFFRITDLIRRFDPEEEQPSKPKELSEERSGQTGDESSIEKRLIVCLGASGAGKSSFLNAGLLRRIDLLNRDFVALPVIRPERYPLTGERGLLRSLKTAFAKEDDRYGGNVAATHGLDKSIDELAARIEAEGVDFLINALLALQHNAHSRANFYKTDGRPVITAPSVLLFIDQGEELFPGKAASVETHRQAAYVRGLLGTLLQSMTQRPKLGPAAQLNGIIMIVMRTDTYPRLQNDEELGKNLPVYLLNLPKLPEASYGLVIEKPAQHWQINLKLDDDVVRRITREIVGEGDGLPLIAFVMGRLWKRRTDGLTEDQRRDNLRITLEDYLEIAKSEDGESDIGSIIALAIDEALRDLPGFHCLDNRDTQTRLRQIFIPALATVNDQERLPLRRIAEMTEFDEDEGFDGTDQRIIDALVDKARVLTKRSIENGGTKVLEVSHESVLRNWKLLAGWLENAANSLGTINIAEADFKRLEKEWDETIDKSEKARIAWKDRHYDQSRLDLLYASLDDVGMMPRTPDALPHSRLKALQSFIELEKDRWIDALGAYDTAPNGTIEPAIDHQRRGDIGVRLNRLGDRRPGVGILTKETLEAEDEEFKKRRRLGLARECDHRNAERLDLIASEYMQGWQRMPDLAWCKVPAGKATLHLGLDDNGKPNGSRTVKREIEQCFWISKYPVTIAQYEAFSRRIDQKTDQYVDGPSDNYFEESYWGHASRQAPHKTLQRVEPDQYGNYAAQYVDWYSAVAYGCWLTERYRRLGIIGEMDNVRLATEWEWVQAATGGEDLLYPWGKRFGDSWHNGVLSRNMTEVTSPTAVGMYPLGDAPTGASDMSGLSHEWCLNHLDLDRDYFEVAPTVEEDLRPTRGGAYYTRNIDGYLPELTPEFAVSVHGRLHDSAIGKNTASGNVRTAVRLVCTGFAEKAKGRLFFQDEYGTDG